MHQFVLSAFADEAGGDLAAQIEVLKNNGIDCIEIRGVNKKNITEYSLEAVKKIKHELDLNGITVSSIGSPVGKTLITEDFEPALKMLEHTLSIAKALNSSYIRIFSFYIPEGDEPATFRDEVIKRIKKYVELAEKEKLTLLHENEKGIYGDTPERCADLLNTIKSDYFKAVFDPANFVQCGVEVYPHAYNLLKDYINYLHIKDACKSDHRVVPAGQGDGRIKDLLSKLAREGYIGFLSLEPHLYAFEGLSELEKSPIDIKSSDSPDKLFTIAVKALREILKTIK